MKTLSYLATFAVGFAIAYALPELPKPTPEPRTIRLDVAPGARETVWSRALAKKLDGQAEFTLPSGRRADVLAGDYIIEIDWPGNVAEGVGQAVLYSDESGRAGVVALAYRQELTPTDRQDLEDLRKMLDDHDLAVWALLPNGK